MSAIRTGSVTANDVEFSYLESGDDGAPLALCLHGFPDSAHGWRHLLPALASAGFHAVAPFQRGYAPTAVPADGLYQSGVLAADAIALHGALGGGTDAVISRVTGSPSWEEQPRTAASRSAGIVVLICLILRLR